MNSSSLLSLLCIILCSFFLAGCPEDEETSPMEPTGDLAASSSNVTVAQGASGTSTLSGGTPPYSIATGPDNSIATATLDGSTLTITGAQGGYTSVVISDASTGVIRIGASVTGAITYTLFPLNLGDQYVYDGYAISTSVDGSVRIDDPGNVYNAVWTIIDPLIPGTSTIHDTTTLNLPPFGTVGSSRVFIISEDPGTLAFSFFQTLGPFFRAFAIEPVGRMDTVRSVRIADPSVGIGGTWTGFDSTYTSAVGAVRLEIVGTLEGGETITDSSASLTERDVVKFRTHRNIYIDGTIVVSNSTTSQLWLQRDVGPVQVHIAEDTENLGHFRTVSVIQMP